MYGVPSSLQLEACSSRDVASAIPSSSGCPTPLLPEEFTLYVVVPCYMLGSIIFDPRLHASLNFGG